MTSKGFLLGLGMEFIEHHPVYIESVLGISLGGQDLVKAVGGRIHHPFLGSEDFHPLAQGRTHPHHIGGNLENDAGLLPVGGAAVNLRSFLAVSATKEKSDCCGKLAVMCRHERLSHQITMAGAVHLNTLHGTADLDGHRADVSPGQAQADLHAVL